MRSAPPDEEDPSVQRRGQADGGHDHRHHVPTQEGPDKPPLDQKAEEEGQGQGEEEGQRKGQAEGEGVGQVGHHQQKLPDGEVHHAGGPVDQDKPQGQEAV